MSIKVGADQKRIDYSVDGGNTYSFYVAGGGVSVGGVVEGHTVLMWRVGGGGGRDGRGACERQVGGEGQEVGERGHLYRCC